MALLVTGEKMGRDEFLSRWNRTPDLKLAELIDGVVFVNQPVSISHSHFDASATGWLFAYSIATPGSATGANATWLMLESARQPDACLYIRPENGGQSKVRESLHLGAPELALEICVTSTDLDFGPKLALYQRAGVQEYITIETLPKRITWRVIRDGSFVENAPGQDGVLRSSVFPGLWLDRDAFWTMNARLMEILQQGLASPEHTAFVNRLKAK